MKEILDEERKKGRHFYGRVIDMSKSPEIYKATRSERERARERLRAREESSGSDQDYYTHLLDQYNKFDDTRAAIQRYSWQGYSAND